MVFFARAVQSKMSHKRLPVMYAVMLHVMTAIQSVVDAETMRVGYVQARLIQTYAMIAN